MLASLFDRCMKRRGVKESDPYDWEKVAVPSQPPSAPCTHLPGSQIISQDVPGGVINQASIGCQQQCATAGAVPILMNAGNQATQNTMAPTNISGLEYVCF